MGQSMVEDLHQESHYQNHFQGAGSSEKKPFQFGADYPSSQTKEPAYSAYTSNIPATVTNNNTSAQKPATTAFQNDYQPNFYKGYQDS